MAGACWAPSPWKGTRLCLPAPVECHQPYRHGAAGRSAGIHPGDLLGLQPAAAPARADQPAVGEDPQAPIQRQSGLPWLQDLKELVASVNQLVSERKRDLLQQRLKISQLSKQVAISSQPLQTLTEVGEGLLQQHFFSTQGSIRLYSRLIPEITPSLDSSPDGSGTCSISGCTTRSKDCNYRSA